MNILKTLFTIIVGLFLTIFILAILPIICAEAWLIVSLFNWGAVIVLGVIIVIVILKIIF